MAAFARRASSYGIGGFSLPSSPGSSPPIVRRTTVPTGSTIGLGLEFGLGLGLEAAIGATRSPNAQSSSRPLAGISIAVGDRPSSNPAQSPPPSDASAPSPSKSS